MPTSTELARLLRGCLKWDRDRPRLDHQALYVVADWCEENGQTGRAEVVRYWADFTEEPITIEANDPYLGPEPWAEGDDGLAPLGEALSRALLDPDGVRVRAEVRLQCHTGGSACASTLLHGSGQTLKGGAYWTYPDEEGLPRWRHPPLHPAVPCGQPPGSLQRIVGLAHWNVVCHLLGFPPLRLLCEE